MTKPRRGPYQQWRQYTTKVMVPITETLKRTHKSVTFAYEGWVISVSTKLIQRKEIQT